MYNIPLNEKSERTSYVHTVGSCHRVGKLAEMKLRIERRADVMLIITVDGRITRCINQRGAAQLKQVHLFYIKMLIRQVL